MTQRSGLIRFGILVVLSEAPQRLSGQVIEAGGEETGATARKLSVFAPSTDGNGTTDMQFTINGPDIPDALLRAHSEGKVVFFCGAGISYPAGLPGFKDLVTKIYAHIGTAQNGAEEEAFKRNQYDATLDLLERRVTGRRLAVRRALAEILRPKLRRRGATATHEALLQLSREKSGSVRLVTTNFDRVFEHVAKKTKQPFEGLAAPMLPIPKNHRWNGVVYLHGLLLLTPTEN